MFLAKNDLLFTFTRTHTDLGQTRSSVDMDIWGPNQLDPWERGEETRGTGSHR